MYKDLIIDSVNKYIIAYRDKNDVLDKKNKEKLKSVPNPSFTNYYKSIKFVFIEAMKTTIKTIFAFDTCFVFRFEKLPSFLIYNPVNNEIEFSFVVHASSWQSYDENVYVDNLDKFLIYGSYYSLDQKFNYYPFINLHLAVHTVKSAQNE